MSAHRARCARRAAKAPGLALGLVLAAALVACAQPSVKMSTSSTSAEPPAAPQTVESLVVTPVDFDSMPAHGRAVVGAIFARLQGAGPGETDDSFRVRGSARIDADRALSENGFRRTGLVLTAFDRLGRSPERYGIEGYAYFADEVDRRATAAFSARYVVGPDAVTLEQADWVSAYPPTPRVEMFVVPADVVTAAGAAPSRGYEALYTLASANAVPMRSPASANQSARPYVIVVFFRDRMPPGSEVAVRISEARDGTSGYGGDTRYAVYDDGWPVATIPGRFALNERDAFWVKAVLAADDGGTTERVVGLFSTAPGS